jgi:hypothetical protein
MFYRKKFQITRLYSLNTRFELLWKMTKTNFMVISLKKLSPLFFIAALAVAGLLFWNKLPFFQTQDRKAPPSSESKTMGVISNSLTVRIP